MLKQVLGYLQMREHQLKQDIQICKDMDDEDTDAFLTFCEGGLNEIDDLINYVEKLIEYAN